MEIIFTTMEVTFRIHQNGEPPTAIAQKSIQPCYKFQYMTALMFKNSVINLLLKYVKPGTIYHW